MDLRRIGDLYPNCDIDGLQNTIDVFKINHYEYFIAQCAHESGKYTRFVENLNYSAQGLMKTWPNRFDEQLANECARNPEKIANVVYANRMGNGDRDSGDGFFFRGRGCIQLTGKNNYYTIEDVLVSYGLCEQNEIIDNPDLFGEPPFAYYSAGAYWKHNNLDSINDFKQLTKKINGGLNGYDDRCEQLAQISSVLD